MHFDKLNKFRNDYKSGKLYIYFNYPLSYFSQNDIKYLRSEWDIAKREFIFSFSSISIYNISKEKYNHIFSSKENLGINNLKGQDFLNYIFTNIEIEKNAVLSKLYKDFSASESLKDDFIPIYFIPQYFYTNKENMSLLDTLKKNILDEFPGLNLYNLTNSDYININKKFKNKFGNFIDNFKLCIEKEKSYILDKFFERGSFNFNPSNNHNDVAENICITSLNVYDAIKYKPTSYKIFDSNSKSSKNKSSYKNYSSNKFNNISYINKKQNKNNNDDTLFYDDSINDNIFNTNDIKNNSSYEFTKQSNTLSNEDIIDFIRLMNYYSNKEQHLSLENIDLFALQLGIDSSKVDRIKSYIISNPLILNFQNNCYENNNITNNKDLLNSNNIFNENNNSNSTFEYTKNNTIFSNEEDYLFNNDNSIFEENNNYEFDDNDFLFNNDNDYSSHNNNDDYLFNDNDDNYSFENNER